MKRFNVFAHDNSRVLCVQEEDGTWVEHDDVARLQAELAAAKALLKRVFDAGCPSCHCNPGWGMYCKLADDFVLTEWNARLPNCPYLPFEEVKE